MDYLDTFSSFAADTRYPALSSDIQEQVGWILADTVAAMVAGSAEPELRSLAAKQIPGTRFWRWTKAIDFHAVTPPST